MPINRRYELFLKFTKYVVFIVYHRRISVFVTEGYMDKNEFCEH